MKFPLWFSHRWRGRVGCKSENPRWERRSSNGESAYNHMASIDGTSGSNYNAGSSSKADLRLIVLSSGGAFFPVLWKAAMIKCGDDVYYNDAEQDQSFWGCSLLWRRLNNKNFFGAVLRIDCAVEDESISAAVLSTYDLYVDVDKKGSVGMIIICGSNFC